VEAEISKPDRRGVGGVHSIYDGEDNITHPRKGTLLHPCLHERTEDLLLKLSGSEEKARTFQRKLYRKAKREKEFRFYSLYDKIWREDILEYAWKRCRANGGSPGTDGKSFKAIENEGVEEFLKAIAQELKENTYRPSPVRRVYIPKADGSKRPLGIPTIKDRIVQTACLIVIEPVFEADFEDMSYGFRPKRSALGAIVEIAEHIQQGFTAAYDADLTKCFDTIPHDVIMEGLERRIADQKVLSLIRKFLRAPVVEPGGPRQGKRNHTGTPQGGVISPLLANIVLDALDKKGKELHRLYNARMVRYADDFVILARYIGDPILKAVEETISGLGLQINQKKTRIVRLQNGEILNFLGYALNTVGKGRTVAIRPSEKAQKKLKEKLREIISRKRLYHGIEGIVKELNPLLRGWKNYFRLTTVKRELRGLDYHITGRFYRVAKKTSQRPSRIFRHGVYATLKRMGLRSLSEDRPVHAFR
jgi:RNA-directed DNA polymerase